jgi:molybdopterin molybdotransferase
MKPKEPALDWWSAQERILAETVPLPAETVELSCAFDRVLSESVVACRALPPWDNSAMDGYAVRKENVMVGQPLPVEETIAAGHPAKTPLAAGTARRIMTGAPVPEGADAVIMREEAHEEAGFVTFQKEPKTGQHIRKQGEDVALSALALPQGTVVGAGEIGLLSALGKLLVQVHRRPTVAIVSTGDELVPADASPAFGQIVNSNAHCLQALLARTGCDARVLPIAVDRLESLVPTFRAALSADVVLSSGGVSVGDFDFVKHALATIGATQHFAKVAMKPGKPLVFCTVDSPKKTLWFGLPGNPASALVSFELFVYPALRRLLGHAAQDAPHPKALVQLCTPVMPDRERTHFLRAFVSREKTPPFSLLAKPLSHQGSGMLSSLVGMNALLEIPPGPKPLDAGTPVEARLLATV